MQNVLNQFFPNDIVEFCIIPYIYDKNLRMQQTKLRNEKRLIRRNNKEKYIDKRQKQLQKFKTCWELAIGGENIDLYEINSFYELGVRRFSNMYNLSLDEQCIIIHKRLKTKFLYSSKPNDKIFNPKYFQKYLKRCRNFKKGYIVID